MSETELVQACLRGDVPSQRVLFVEHRGALRNTFTRCGFNSADVSELEQRVWLRLLGPRKALASYSGSGSLSGWLRRVAINEARSEMRRRQRGCVLEGLEPVHEPSSRGHDPERVVMRDEKRALLGAALEEGLLALEPSERDLLMAWAKGSTAEALATANGVHRSSMSRRLDKLRRRVGARLKSALWEHYGRCSSEISLTHVEAPA